MNLEQELAANLRKFKIRKFGKRPSILGGVKRKSRWAGLVRCQTCGLVWLDKIFRLPHTPVCPRGHVQCGADGLPVQIGDPSQESGYMDERSLKIWGLARDIASGGIFDSRLIPGKDTFTIEEIMRAFSSTVKKHDSTQ